jgi:hypothetical protein
MNELLDQLIYRLRATERRDRRFHTDCPFCGKEEKRGQKHFSFCESGYKCFVCEAQGGLVMLARHVGQDLPRDTSYVPRMPKAPAPEPTPRTWQQDPERLIAGYTLAANRFLYWGMYKPLSRENIMRCRLGVGVLPSSRCEYPRLILPVFEDGVCVALHGRAFLPRDTEAKWLTAGGSRKNVLFNADALTPGCTVVICENMVDALLAQQIEPSVVAVAVGGVSWNDAWTEQIASFNPKKVWVWFDNDLVGCPNAETSRKLLDTWHAEMQQRVDTGAIPSIPAAPRPRGPQLAQTLAEAGLPAVSYVWPSGTPPKADLGWRVEEQLISDDVARIRHYRAGRPA